MRDIILFTQNVPEATREISSVGGHISHILTNNIIVASFPESFDLNLLRSVQSNPPDKLDPEAELVIKAWEAKETKARRKDRESLTEGLAWDTPGYQAPDPSPKDRKKRFK